jgi:formamidopyrimidine-DNA glycosylase
MKPLLCDQALLSGLGSMWSDEVLFHARISPESPGKALAPADFARLRDAIHEVLTAAIEAKGAVEGGFTTLDGKPGTAEKLLGVYRRVGEPCRVCGATVRQTKVSGKTTYVCRKCQPKKSAPKKRRQS